MTDLNIIINIYNKIINLKKLKRKGWVLKGIKEPESVADHTFGVSVLALLIKINSKKKINLEKILKYSILHDIAEYKIGDITPHDKISKSKKYKLEYETIKELTSNFSSNEILEAWQEFEHSTSFEAKLVRDLDIFETIFQAMVYEKEQKNIDLSEFWNINPNNFQTEEVKNLYEILLLQRDEKHEHD